MRSYWSSICRISGPCLISEMLQHGPTGRNRLYSEKSWRHEPPLSLLSKAFLHVLDPQGYFTTLYHWDAPTQLQWTLIDT
jgi:hypothetical protein